MTGHTTAKGFTLVEILVVIAIIGILASLLISNFYAARDRALAARMLADFHAFERAFQLWFLDLGIERWLFEDEFCTREPYAGCDTTNPLMVELWQNTSLKNYLSSRPGHAITGAQYEYDYDWPGDTQTCGPYPAYVGGVNFYSRFTPDKYSTILDKMVDSADGGNCGRVTWHSAPPLVTIAFNVSREGKL